MIGRTLGSYEVVARLGEGGMGEVYRARDTKLNRDVAIKILPDVFAHDTDRVARFTREAQTLAALNHPHIAQIYGILDEGQEGVGTHVHALVMELVEGDDLSALIARPSAHAQGVPSGVEGRGLPLADALPIAKQIADALEAAHEQGIIHRDLKPANIKVRADGTVKVLDFGLAKAMDPAGAEHSPTMTSPALTDIGVILGTASYMSPEQARGKAVDRRADIWALGAVLYEMLAGRPLFRGDTVTETMAHVITQPPDWTALPLSTPPPVRRLLLRCLEKDTKHRYQSAGDVRLDIDEILAGRGESHDSRDVVRTAAPRRNSTSLVIVALLGLAGTAIAGLWPRSAAGPGAPTWSATFLGGPALAYGPRLSQDGRMLAFQAILDGLSQVAVMNPERGNWTVLTRERDAGFVENVGWSADGSSILFSRRGGQSLNVFSVPALGGEPRLVLENASAPQGLAGGRVALLRPNANRQTQLHTLDPGTGAVQPLNAAVVAGGEVGIPAIPYRVFPDGRTIVFYGVPADAPSTATPAVYLIDVGTNTPRLAADLGASVVSAIAVDPRDRSLFVSVFSGEGQRVLHLSPNGDSAPEAVLTLTDRSGLLDVGPDGSLYLDQVNRPMQVLRFSPRDTTAQVLATVPLSRILESVVLELPDGRLLTTDYFNGRPRLLAITASGEISPFVDTSDATSGPAALVGPDRVAFLLGTPPEQFIAVASVKDGRISQRLRAAPPGAIRGLTASPDGDRLFYSCGGVIWSASPDGGAPTRLGDGDAVAYDPRRGDLVVQLFSSDGAGARLGRMPVTGGATTPIAAHGRAGLASPSALGPHAVRADGAIAVTVAVNDSWFFRPAVLDPETGALEPVALAYTGDFLSLTWNARGEMVAGGFQLRTGIWRFRPDR